MCLLIVTVLFLIRGWNTNVIVRAERPEFKDFAEVKLYPVFDYENKIFTELDKGEPITEFKAVAFDRFVEERHLCDLQTTVYPHEKSFEWGYIPAMCAHKATCTNVFESGVWSNYSCTVYAAEHRNQDPDYICCPVQKTTDYLYSPILSSSQMEPDKLFSYNEVPTNFRFLATPYTAMTQRNAGTVTNLTVIQTAFNNNYIQKIQSAKVCGFKKGEKILDASRSRTLADVYGIIPFFCTPPNFCRANSADERKPHDGWNYFCENQIKYEASEVGRTVCCHSDDIDKAFFGNYAPLHLPQLPTYLKYATGLRSAYKCEEYAKRACQGGTSKCEPRTHPHFAVLGFVAPKFMKFHCGGTLVSVRYILSTDRCKQYFGFTTNVVLLGEQKTSDRRSFTAEVLQHNSGSVWSPLIDERAYIVAEILSYKDDGFYKQQEIEPQSGAKYLDLALYKTERDVELTHTVRPACLFHQPVTPWPFVLDFTGFGPVINDEYRSEDIKTLELYKLPRRDCSSETTFDKYDDQYYGQYGVKTPELICYHNDKSPTLAPCRYDRGGPLQFNLSKPHCSVQLMGVLSSNKKDCQKYYPHVFINITKFINEIEDAVWGNYTFIDIFDKDLERAPCVEDENLMFFNKQPNS